MSGANKALVRRAVDEVITGGNFSLLAEIMAPEFVNHDLPAPEPGPRGFQQVVETFRNAFSGMRVLVEDRVAEGDRVAQRGHFTGKHTGEFMGIAPTGRDVDVSFIDIWRISNGKLIENWIRLDMMSLMQQLGVMQAPA